MRVGRLFFSVNMPSSLKCSMSVEILLAYLVVVGGILYFKLLHPHKV